MHDTSGSEQQPGGDAAPAPSRPQIEGYGIPASDEGMLPWRQANEWLERARLYWVATTRPDGRPHATPIWGAWVDETFYFEGGARTRRGRNLAANPAVAVHLERDDAVVLLEGVAEITTPDPATFARIADAFTAKYKYRPETGEGMYAVRPRVVLAWRQFPVDATRWRFGEG
jgi:PPOX class probable F420-dependent enzyme